MNKQDSREQSNLDELTAQPALALTTPDDEMGERRVKATHLARTDWTRLRALPWGTPLEEWPERGVATLTVRRGESRHPVLFVEAGRRRYAIKETSPVAARREIGVLEELQRRRCNALEPAGWVVVRGDPIYVGDVAGRPQYMSGDVGYCITRLAERVLPQSLLYRYPFTDPNKRLLWNAIAELLLDLHEAGVYWGDPSLANVLMDLSGHRLTAVMADAETAEVVNGPLDEGLRRQDLDSFVESLEWQAEDIRIARELSEEQRLVTEGDAYDFLSRYAGLRAERERAHARNRSVPLFARAREIERSVQRLNALGYGVLAGGTRALRSGLEVGLEDITTGMALASEAVDPGMKLQIATLRPGWYVQRLRELLGVRVPRVYARRIYQHINVHKWLMSERAGRDVGMAVAARDWLEYEHQPAMAFLESYLPHANSAMLYAAYVAILDHTWEMSLREQRPVPLEEGAMDYALRQTKQPPERKQG